MVIVDYIYIVIRGAYRMVQRARLKNKNFSIICQNCIGGVIYHDLGLPFLSPTINLWMEEKDFYKFAANLKEYTSCPLVFVEGIDSTPTAYCKDILIHFNHYHNKEEAETKWIERCNRINWDNLYFICSDRWSSRKEFQPSEEDIRSLGKVSAKGRCVFAIKDYEGLDYIYHLRKDPDDDCVYPFMVDKYKIFPFWKWQFKFDYVKWLNEQK